MKLNDISEGETKPQESTVKHLDIVEAVTTLFSSMPELPFQLQVSTDDQELNPHATEDDSACAIEDEPGCEFDSEQSDTQDTPTFEKSITSSVQENAETLKKTYGPTVDRQKGPLPIQWKQTRRAIKLKLSTEELVSPITQEETKPQESTVKHLDIVEAVTTLVPSKQPRQSFQLQVSTDDQELNPHATEDDIACAVEDETGCEFDSTLATLSPYSKTSDTQDTPTSANSMTSDNSMKTAQIGRLSQNSVEKKPSLHEIARQMTSMLSRLSSRFESAPVTVSLLTHNTNSVKYHSIRVCECGAWFDEYHI